MDDKFVCDRLECRKLRHICLNLPSMVFRPDDLARCFGSKSPVDSESSALLSTTHNKSEISSSSRAFSSLVFRMCYEQES